MDRLNNRLRKCLGFKTPNQLCSGCGGWIPSPLGSGQPSTPLCWENRWHATGPLRDCREHRTGSTDSVRMRLQSALDASDPGVGCLCRLQEGAVILDCPPQPTMPAIVFEMTKSGTEASHSLHIQGEIR